MTTSVERQLASLRQRAEVAIAESRRESEVAALLVRILGVAEERSEPAIFAHRHLAEIRLTDNPWQAALHLRKVLAELPQDHVAHALMGLSQALLGNYEAAVASFKRAMYVAPRIPWYLHNVGHLLDVALDAPERAETYLRKARELAPDHDEVTASLAHCLARLGILDEAMILAMEAGVADPKNENHQALLTWISQGAPQKLSSRSEMSLSHGLDASLADVDKTDVDSNESASDEAAENLNHVDTQVSDRVRAWISKKGHDVHLASSAQALWVAFLEKEGCSDDVQSEEHMNIRAAALAYATCRLNGVKYSQRNAAMEWGVPFGAMGQQWRDFRDVLDLTTGDPRFCV